MTDRPDLIAVAINVPLSRTFDYLAIPGQPRPAPGCRVKVPFGRRHSIGVVLSHPDSTDVSPSKLRRVDEYIDDAPILDIDDLWLIRFTSDYYHHPIGEVVFAALPQPLRLGKPVYPVVTRITSTAACESVDMELLARRAPKQAQLLQHVLDAGGNGYSTDTLTDIVPNWRRAAKALFEKGYLQKHDELGNSREESSADNELQPTPGPTLNAAQKNALQRILSKPGFSVHLLDGVTGSGKTEVYLQRIGRALDDSAQVLVLVPEIGLTPQLIRRFEKRLGFAPAVMHSGLGDAQRLSTWRQARSGQARLVIGTRSAVFLPFARLGLIIIDEEHDASLKQQEGLRYSARDLAIARAKHLNRPIILGSATPSLELLHHAILGNYERIVLNERAGGARAPTIRLVDTLRSPATNGISEPFAQAIRRHLDADGQVLVFLNRRGYAPTLICSACGYLAGCKRCDARMTVHAGLNQLRCHHCGSARALPTNCEECNEVVRPLGEGTERLEETLSARFPDAHICRIDSDTVQQKGAMASALASAVDGRANILVGTQMLSKGHHFPNLTLVGVVNADQGLFGTDFRSSERLAQSIIQVAGRAGREKKAGEVLIQTAFADHAFWPTLIDNGYAAIAENALLEREKTAWPPYSRLALLRAAAHKQADAIDFLEAAAQAVLGLKLENLRVLGPVDAPMARRRGRFRAQLLLQCSDRPSLHHALKILRPTLEAAPAARRVRWSIDVDPIELF